MFYWEDCIRRCVKTSEQVAAWPPFELGMSMYVYAVGIQRMKKIHAMNKHEQTAH